MEKITQRNPGKIAVGLAAQKGTVQSPYCRLMQKEPDHSHHRQTLFLHLLVMILGLVCAQRHCDNQISSMVLFLYNHPNRLSMSLTFNTVFDVINMDPFSVALTDVQKKSKTNGLLHFSDTMLRALSTEVWVCKWASLNFKLRNLKKIYTPF